MHRGLVCDLCMGDHDVAWNAAVLYFTILPTNQLHASESLLKSWLILSWSRNFPHFMEPKVHYHVHKRPLVPLFEPDESNQQHRIKIAFGYIFYSPVYTYIIQVISSLLVSQPKNPVCILLMRHAPSIVSSLSVSLQYSSLISSCNFLHPQPMVFP